MSVEKNDCLEIKTMIEQKIKKKNEFDTYVKMIRKFAWQYAKKFRMDYSDVEAQGFLIYSMAIQDFHKKKASFSTYLYINLHGRLRDYCRIKTKKEYLDNLDKPFETYIDLWEAKEEQSIDQFLQYAQSDLSSTAFNILKWLLNDRLSGFKSCKNPSLVTMSEKLSMDIVTLKLAWQELSNFWNWRGAAFYAVS
ncbi:MAG: hypothetical protein LBQ93_03730 [Treponema sp.]|jgi:DNA-directed RNA polymerase specialized sigma24 family protein|nr:hypothetical protein [Treponema sp.]